MKKRFIITEIEHKALKICVKSEYIKGLHLKNWNRLESKFSWIEITCLKKLKSTRTSSTYFCCRVGETINDIQYGVIKFKKSTDSFVEIEDPDMILKLYFKNQFKPYFKIRDISNGYIKILTFYALKSKIYQNKYRSLFKLNDISFPWDADPAYRGSLQEYFWWAVSKKVPASIFFEIFKLNLNKIDINELCTIGSRFHKIERRFFLNSIIDKEKHFQKFIKNDGKITPALQNRIQIYLVNTWGKYLEQLNEKFDAVKKITPNRIETNSVEKRYFENSKYYDIRSFLEYEKEIQKIWEINKSHFLKLNISKPEPCLKIKTCKIPNIWVQRENTLILDIEMSKPFSNEQWENGEFKYIDAKKRKFVCGVIFDYETNDFQYFLKPEPLINRLNKTKHIVTYNGEFWDFSHLSEFGLKTKKSTFTWITQTRYMLSEGYSLDVMNYICENRPSNNLWDTIPSINMIRIDKKHLENSNKRDYLNFRKSYKNKIRNKNTIECLDKCSTDVFRLKKIYESKYFEIDVKVLKKGIKNGWSVNMSG